MFDSALAFGRYRLEVVRRWPESEAKTALLAAIESSLRKDSTAPDRSSGTASPESVEQVRAGFAWRFRQ
jgi:hypothetical protein